MKIPLDPSIKEALVVPMTIYDRAGEESVGLVAAVDTGATVTMIPRDAARKLGYPVDSIEPERFVAGDGVFYAPRVTLGRVDTGPASAANVDAICHDLPEETTLEALVGLSFLTRFDVRFDFAAWQMELAPRADGGSEEPSEDAAEEGGEKE